MSKELPEGFRETIFFDNKPMDWWLERDARKSFY